MKRRALLPFLLVALLAGASGCLEEGISDGGSGESDMGAPLFIKTPYLKATNVNSDPDSGPILTTVASQPNTKTTTLLIETLRYWYVPAPVGGRSAGYVKLAILAPDATVVYLERHEVTAAAVEEYPPPAILRLDLLLPPGYSLQLLSTPEVNQLGVPAVCNVVAQGGELG